jgi:hypothetical protein
MARPLLFSFASICGLALLPVGCHEQSEPARSVDKEERQEEAASSRHERFKNELRETTQAAGAGLERAQVKTQKAVRHAGRELGIRGEVLGTGSGSGDAGAGR